MDNLISKISGMAGAVKSSIENSAFLKQHTRDYSDPSQYIDAQTARERMLALPLPPNCTWVQQDADPSMPLTMKIHSVGEIVKNIGGFLLFSLIFAAMVMGFSSSLLGANAGFSAETLIFIVICLVLLLFFFVFLRQVILSFYPKFVIFDGDTITVSRKMKKLYRDRTYSIHEAYIRANVDNNNNRNEQSFQGAILDIIFKDYHIYICESLQGSNYRWSKSSRRLVTVKSILNGFKAANYFSELIHIQRLVKK